MSAQREGVYSHRAARDTGNTKDKDKPEVTKKRKSLSRVTDELTAMGPQVKFRLIHEDLPPEDIEKDPNMIQLRIQFFLHHVPLMPAPLGAISCFRRKSGL